VNNVTSKIYTMTAYLIVVCTWVRSAALAGDGQAAGLLGEVQTAPVSQGTLAGTLVLGLLACPWTGLARPVISRWWTRVAPRLAERSIGLALKGGALVLLYWQWGAAQQPTGAVTHHAGLAASQAVLWVGRGVLLASCCPVGHFEPFGLRRFYLWIRSRILPGMIHRKDLRGRQIRHRRRREALIGFWIVLAVAGGVLLALVATNGRFPFAASAEGLAMTAWSQDGCRCCASRAGAFIPAPVQIFGNGCAGATWNSMAIPD
jgi:hypothetical protein